MLDWLLEYLRWLASFLSSFFDSAFLNYFNPTVGEDNHPEHYYFFSNVELIMGVVFFIFVFGFSYYLFQIMDRKGNLNAYYPTSDRRHKNWIGHIVIGPISLVGGYFLTKILPGAIYLLLSILGIALFVLAFIAPLIVVSVTAALIFKGLEKRAQPSSETE